MSITHCSRPSALFITTENPSNGSVNLALPTNFWRISRDRLGSFVSAIHLIGDPTESKFLFRSPFATLSKITQVYKDLCANSRSETAYCELIQSHSFQARPLRVGVSEFPSVGRWLLLMFQNHIWTQFSQTNIVATHCHRPEPSDPHLTKNELQRRHQSTR